MNHHIRGRPTRPQPTLTRPQAIIESLSEAVFSFPQPPPTALRASISPSPEVPFGEAYRPLIEELVSTTIRAHLASTNRESSKHSLRQSIKQLDREVKTIRELLLESAGNLRECITALRIPVAIPHPIEIDQLINTARNQLGLNTDKSTAPGDGLAIAVMAKSSAIMQRTEVARSSLQKVIEGCVDLRRRGEGVLLSGQRLRGDISGLQKEIKDLQKRNSHALPRRQARLEKLLAEEARIKEEESATISELTQEATALVKEWVGACKGIEEAFQSTGSCDEELTKLTRDPIQGRGEFTTPDYLMKFDLATRGSLVCKLLLISLSDDGRSITPAQAIQTMERDLERGDPAAASFNLEAEHAKTLDLIQSLLQTVFPHGYSILHAARIVRAHWNVETPASRQFNFAKRLVAHCLEEIIREWDRAQALGVVVAMGGKPIPLPRVQGS